MGRFVRGIGVAAVCALVSACGTATTGITTSAAKTVVQEYNAANSKANNTLDVSLQNLHEEGASVLIDNAYYQLFKLMGQKSEGGTYAVPKWNTTVYPGKTSGWPKYFLADVRTTSKPVAPPQLFLFAQDAKNDPWRVQYEIPVGSLANPIAVPRVANSQGTISINIPNDTSMFAAFARYRSNYTVASSSKFAGGEFTSGWNLKTQSQFAGLSTNGTVSVSCSYDSQYQPLALPLAQGGTLVFAVFRTVDAVSMQSQFYLQQSRTRSVLPAFLAPGAYSSMKITQLDEVAFIIPQGSGKIQVIGDYGGIINASGTKTSTGSGTPSGTTTLSWND